MGTVAQIIFALILIHLVIGFGFIFYKLTPKKGDRAQEDTSSEPSE